MQKKTGKSTGREEVLKANDQVLHDNKVKGNSSAELPGFLTSWPIRKSRKVNPSEVHQHLCFHVSSVSKGCFLWHLGPGRWTDHASMARTPQSKDGSDQHTVVTLWGQGEGSTPGTSGALSSHTTSLWISSLLCHGPISTCTGAWVCDHHNRLKKLNKVWKTTLNFYL